MFAYFLEVVQSIVNPVNKLYSLAYKVQISTDLFRSGN